MAQRDAARGGGLVACDLIGMGASDKLDDAGPDRYHYHENRDYLFAPWDALDLGDRVTLALHDGGGGLGLDWANQNRDRVASIVHIETLFVPMQWDDFSSAATTCQSNASMSKGVYSWLAAKAAARTVIPLTPYDP